MFRQKIFENKKSFPTLCLQLVDLIVSLKLSEDNVSYHFPRILFMKGSHLCRCRMKSTASQFLRDITFPNFQRKSSLLFTVKTPKEIMTFSIICNENKLLPQCKRDFISNDFLTSVFTAIMNYKRLLIKMNSFAFTIIRLSN